MSPTPRAPRPPAVVAGCWAASVAAGAALLAVGPTAPRPEPAELSPYSVAAYLTRIAGPDAQDVRVNGLYGSGHSGAWQFQAHISWRGASGDIVGGRTELPQLAGTSPLLSDFSLDRLASEHRIGWTAAELDKALDALGDVDAPLAMVELEIYQDGEGDVQACSAVGTGQRAACHVVDRRGRRSALAAGSRLTDAPAEGALSVRVADS